MKEAHDLIAIALAEDIGQGDVTGKFFVDAARHRAARIIAKEPAVVAGVEVAAAVFERVDKTLERRIVRNTGDDVAAGEPVLELYGRVQSMLAAERVALNFLQHLSGIATLTRKFVDEVRATKAVILDTRKTTPGLRALEKAAVKAGGGQNHRFGLFDMVMVKDNHLAAADGLDFLRDSIRKARAEHRGIRVELEADNLDQVSRFLELDGVDVILLDNMSPQDMRKAVGMGKGRVKFEASGGITLENAGDIAATGVDFISVGALTHSARAIDFSLELAE
jgi:nicotinate-nucleotide pyrophosphorylase (carboxylating)